MRQITIIATRNGWLVIDGDGSAFSLVELATLSWSFNSFEAVIAHMSLVLKSWEKESER